VRFVPLNLTLGALEVFVSFNKIASVRTLQGLTITSASLLAAIGFGCPQAAQAQAAGFSSPFVTITNNLDAAGSSPTSSSASAGASLSPDFKPAGGGASKPPVAKVVNGGFGVAVDNGWVIYNGFQNSATIALYNADANGNFNPGASVKISHAGALGTGISLAAGGVIFAPCTGGKCAASEGSVTGFGLGYGQMFSSSTPAGGWVGNTAAASNTTNPPPVKGTEPTYPGSIAGLGLAKSGSTVTAGYAVGWAASSATAPVNAVVLTLNPAKEFNVSATSTLPPLGGLSSRALGVNRTGTVVVGSADIACSKPTCPSHAVYATLPLPATPAWTDIAPALGTSVTLNGSSAPVVKSHAVSVSNNGQYIAGVVTVEAVLCPSATVYPSAAGCTTTPSPGHPYGTGRRVALNQGFVYNTANQSATLILSPIADVAPVKVLDNGEVVGNLSFVAPLGTASLVNHPFFFNGSSVTDFGLMTYAIFPTPKTGATTAPSLSCEVWGVNSFGEAVGRCTRNTNAAIDPNAGSYIYAAFYLNAASYSGGAVTTPTYVDLGSVFHTNEDSTVALFKPYGVLVGSSIDDAEEITVVGFNASNSTRASFLASKAAY
jgi:hypothetical protein